MAEGGRRAAGGGRDAALTWDVPPPLESGEAGAAAAARPAFAAVAAKHLEALVRQLLQAEGIQTVDAWAPLLCELAGMAAAALSPTAAAAHGKLDPRHYIKVKRLVSPSAAPANSCVVLGVACRKSLAHKRMRSFIAQPRIMLLAGGLEAQPAAGAASLRSSGGGGLGGASYGGGSAAAAAALNRSSLSSFDALLDQEQQTLAAAVERIASFSPDVLLVERSVARYAQELLLQKDISLVLNVKHELLERVALCTGALVAPSVDQLSSHCIGFCKEFEVESLPSAAGAAAAAAAATGGAEASPHASEGSDAQHLVVDAAALRRSGAAGAAGSGPRTIMLFRGCPRPLGSTILLRGSDAGELRRVKRVASFAAYAAYWGLLESALLADQLASAAAAVLPGGCQPEAVAGLADAVASTSFLATAAARGRQAILSASPHVSVVLERGAPAEELELLTPDSEQEAPGLRSSDGSGNGSGSEEAEAEAASEWDDGEAVGSPASSDSTQLWVVPAVAGGATFTVSGSQSQTEMDELDAAAQQQQPAQQRQLESTLGREASWGAASSGLLPPGLMAYRSQQLWLTISCKNPAKGVLCEPAHAHCMQYYADTDLPLGAFLSAAAPSNRKCPHPQCGDGAPLHLRSFMHANGLVTLSSVRLPAGKELPDSGVWLWLRPTSGRGGSDNGGAVRRVALSPEAACLSFAHLLSLLFDARQLALGGASLQRDFVRYLGAGSTLLCLHFSPASAYAVRMPPRCVGLLPASELEWLQEEVKALTEEADEAFGAIEFALQQQLRSLPPLEPASADDGGGGDAVAAAAAAAAADAEFRQMWLDTLADTRASFLELVQDTVVQLDSSSQGDEAGGQQQQEQAAAQQLVPMVWELNKLRSMLAAVVLQWATCLQEGAAGSHAAPPSGGGMLSTMLATRRQAGGRHSRRGSVAEETEGPEAAAGELPASPTAVQQREAGPSLGQQQLDASVPLQEQQQAGQPTLPAEPAGAGQPAEATLQRSVSGASLGQQFLEAGFSQELGQRAASELDFGAPSLMGGEEGSVGGASLATSPQGGGALPVPSSIPTGLVARYVAMFDQRGPEASPGSPGSSPTSQRRRSQRTLNWVQASSPAAGEGSGAASEAATASGSPAQPAASAAKQQQGEQQVVPPLQQPLTRQRSSLFRLDLTSPDPDLAHALTPSRRRTSYEGETAPGTVASRLEQISARLGRMSLTQSFTERRRSSALLHAASADQAMLRQAMSGQDYAALQPVAEQTASAAAAGPAAAVPAAASEQDQPLAEQQQPALAQQQQQQQQAQPQALALEQQPKEPGGAVVAAAAEEVSPPSAQPSGSHFEQWSELLPADGAAEAAAAGKDGRGSGGSEAAGVAGVLPSTLQMLKSASSGKLEAIAKLQEAPMPASVAPPASAAEPVGEAAAPAAAAGAAATALVAAAAPAAGAPAAAGLPLPAGSSRSASASLAQMGRSLSNLLTPVGSAAQLPLSLNSTPAASPAAGPLPEKAPSRLRQLLGKLRSEPAPGQLPLPTGRVELSGRALLPGGADGMRVAVFDEEPTSIIAYCLATREYQQYLHDAVATILFGEAGQRSSAAPSPGGGLDGGAANGEAAVPGSWQSLPTSPRGTQPSGRRVSSLVPALQQQQQQQQQAQDAVGGGGAADVAPSEASAASAAAPAAAAATAAVPAAPVPAFGQSPAPSTRTVTQEELAAEQSGDWQVLFCEQQLDCQLALEDPSPGMPWGRARFQVTAYYAPQFAELRRRCVAGGEAAFLASLSRCRKWASRGGKSAAYFARSCDKRYIVKQLSRSERQSFLEFAPDYFRYVATMLHRGQDTCLAKILGVYQVSVQYSGGRGAPSGPSWGGKEGTMDLLITENVFYGREAQVARIYDLKGSQRDRYAADDPTAAGAVLLDENLQELNLSSPTLVGPRAYACLQRALWSDTGFLAGLGVMDYSLLVGVDKARGELVVGVIDYCRQYTWDKQVETWVKKSGILGGAGKDPTVISPKQYSRRFRIAMSSYLTVVPFWEAPEPPLDPDAM
ncbi:FAB FYVE-domain PI-3,4-kinase [Chlorella sorokiniana]|uniref:1-phosphatidylinositol-3-phosphate 5-kinase n=1 Tax=Chlorella sorokiniana TaxID=3076 RepID=A0A2P6TEU1_CHLSO|nr:FAB FYVE-domain PI-3,4-kinase [Chlorella sorokiniana]|eukprot:PRW32495.1 FAB FYVE-domain PI-3,4-kinase [Chlorella sorokiniana]